jgi:glycine/D-amino acid oxidase-like deaminating enzyme
MKVDFLIIGQGIAGTVMSYTLLNQGKKVLVIDDNPANNATKVAAGICNPITGRKLVKTWLADQIFPFLKSFYQNLANELGCNFLRPIPIYRPFRSLEEQNEWFGRSADENWRTFINTDVENERFAKLLDNPMGGWETKQSYQIDTELLINSYQDYLIEKGMYQESKFDWKELQIFDNQVYWQNITASKVIFCEGIQALQNPFFNWLPFNPVKGEWIKIKVEKQARPLESIINQGVFILPLTDTIWQVGATYHWGDMGENTTELAQKELLDKLNDLLKIPFEVIEQKAGVRPATQQRRPFIGLHPIYPQLGIFNGLGTKGISLAPYLAQSFADFLDNANLFPLNNEVNIQKYYHLCPKNINLVFLTK